MNTTNTIKTVPQANEPRTVILQLLSAGVRLAKLIEETPMTPEQKENLSSVVVSLTRQVEAIQISVTEEDFDVETAADLIKNSKESLRKTEEFLVAMSA